jgi:hypothetical protein
LHVWEAIVSELELLFGYRYCVHAAASEGAPIIAPTSKPNAVNVFCPIMVSSLRKRLVMDTYSLGPQAVTI